MSSVIVGEDSMARCPWAAGSEEYRRYHDEEWGTTLRGDQALFEKLSLEAFQAGLSWITILKRRTGFREAFHDFTIDRVAAMTDADVESLMGDTRIIRNRSKILATISNARIASEFVGSAPGALDSLMWSFAPASSPQRESLGDVPAVTPESTALSSALRKLGFRFVGPTTMYALMQSTGMVDDHVVGCHRARFGHASLNG